MVHLKRSCAASPHCFVLFKAITLFIMRIGRAQGVWGVIIIFFMQLISREVEAFSSKRVTYRRIQLGARRQNIAEAPPATEPSSESSQRSVVTMDPSTSIAKDEGHMNVSKLLREYGIIALFFHFTVWITSLSVTYSLLSSTGVDVEALEALRNLIGGDSPEATEGIADATEAGAGAAKAAATVAIVEALGPLRLGLTIAATPSVSSWARQFEAVRDAENALMGRWESSTAAMRKILEDIGSKEQ